MKYYIILEDKMFCNETELRLSEPQMIDLGYSIIEVDKEDCCFEDFDENGFNKELYNQRKEREYAENRISQLKQNLANTDYIANKLAEAIAEYIKTGDNTKVYELKTKYAKQLQDRKSWRDEIEKLGG